MTRRLATLAAVAAFLLPGIQPAFAKTSPSIPVWTHPDHATCVRESWVTAVNVCAFEVRFFFPLTVNDLAFSPGAGLFATPYANVIVRAQSNNTAANIRCMLVSNGPQGLLTSALVGLPYYGAPAEIALGVSVPPGNALSIACYAGPGAQIINYSWNL